jgi:Ca2+-binding EF-hand superfamily protein
MKPRAFVTAILIGFSGVALCASSSDAGEQRQAQMRFQSMDANGDGRISRDEWRGNDQAFRRQDWNGDGMLAGDEVRPSAPRQLGQEDEVDQRRPEFRNWTERGFTNLDRNGDGRIQRAEWFYARAGFTRADSNSDGVLSRAEFLRGDIVADRGDRFEDLDGNNDNLITSNEWRWSRRNFALQDRNGDGQLTRGELTNAELAALEDATVGAVGTSGDAGRVVTVEAARGWVDTGIIVRRGDYFSIDASGTVTLSSNGNDFADPAGSRLGRRAESAPLPNASAGALIARINNGAPMLVGNRRTIMANDSGRLFLSVNDDFFPDNVGEFRATVTVGR